MSSFHVLRLPTIGCPAFKGLQKKFCSRSLAKTDDWLNENLSWETAVLATSLHLKYWRCLTRWQERRVVIFSTVGLHSNLSKVHSEQVFATASSYQCLEHMSFKTIVNE